MRQLSYPVLGAILGTCALFATPAAKAASFDTTLNTLVDGGSNQAGITLGDKRYYNFTFSSSGDAPVAAGAVDVSLVSTDNDNHYQLRFTFARDALDANANQTTDVVIGYRIDVLGAQLMNRVGLGFNGTVSGTTSGDAASVVETIRTSDGSEVAAAFPGQSQIVIGVHNDGTGGLPDSSSVSLAVNPTRSLQFEKDILVSSRPGGSRVVITTVDNFVNQVPEPTSAAILGAAGALLLTRRRRT